MKSIKIKTLLLLLCTGFMSSAKSQTVSYTIDGKIPGMTSGKIYFNCFCPSGESDSAIVKNGSFHFKGLLTEPSPVILSFERQYVNRPMCEVFVDNGKHTVVLKKDDLENSLIKGGVTTMDYEELKSIEKPFNKRFEAIFKNSADTSKAAREEREEKRAATMNERKAAIESFIKSHPASPVAAWATYRNFGAAQSDEPKLKELFKTFPTSLAYTSYYQEMKKSIAIAERLSIGNVAPDFTQNDTLGKPVSLSDFRGKYVLIDFWASWCHPCRMDNPNVVKAFNRFKDKGFTILGISLDQPGKKEAWMNAIHQDGLTWTHVSDLKFWNNEVVKLYGIMAVPSNFLIDPTGKIIARDLHGEEIEKTISKFIN